MYKIAIILTILLFYLKFSISHEFTFTQLKTCQEYQVNDSFYKEFFKVDNLEQNNRSENELIRLNFFTLTLMDAHILLSETDSPQLSDKVYDIVIGAGQNTYSTIRAKLNSDGVARVDGSINFDPWIPTPIEISQTIDGKLTVLIFNEEYISFIDNNPLLINFVSFKSYGGIPAKWFYDCKFNGHEYDITMENRKISDMERLEHYLFTEYDPYNKPLNLNKLNIIFHINGAFHDEKKSILKTRISIKMIWEDSRLKWNSSEFGDINIITGTEYNIWLPILVIYNGAESTHKGVSLRGVKQKIFENGKIEIEAKNTEISTWCESASNWPFMNLSCEIRIGEAHENVRLCYNKNSNLNFLPVNSFIFWRVNNYTSLDKLDKTDLVVEFLLKKNKNFYLCVYYPPIFTSITFIILSFILKEEKRGLVNLLAIVIVLTSLLFLSKHTTNYSKSSLVDLYIGVSIISTFTYFLHVLILCLKNFSPLLSPSEWLLRVIYSRIIRFFLGMNFTKCDYVDVHANPWKLLAEVINRISLIFVLLAFTVTICKNI
ncbi:neuronal acetylcholine receptor subunit alpha-2 [Condylostylus longicornis]|uniref:neuronal acetylcholine receptor subunit alpha-2 n=1 Tax=Condylostylus longicornis TaxID=2530218 RepID=UPI00244E54D1|nr:neuronal acetylcholine receptor subunit alpha-2 [Condylostylus longicornis]